LTGHKKSEERISFLLHSPFPLGEKMYGLYVLPLLQRSAERDMNVTELEVARILYSFNFNQSVAIAGAEVRTGELGATLALLVSSNEAR
jgi:hypothetical protein